MTDPVFGPLADRLRPGDDPTLWALAVDRVLEDVTAVVDALEPAPRHLLLAFALVRARDPSLHPDEGAHFRLWWSRARGDDAWVPEPHPRIRRKRGHYTATACLPGGSAKLARAHVTVLWRPRLPWAPPTNTEMGRQVYTFSRDAASRWRFDSVRET